MRLLRKSLFIAVLLAAMPAHAQSPPARVGRVSAIEGTLAFYQNGDPDWSRANCNLPVASGEWFATDRQSRAGLRIGSVSVGIAGDTQFQVVDLREQMMRLELPQGRVNLDLRRQRTGDTAAIDLARGTVSMLQPGIYDIDAGAPDQPIRITVFAGSARFAGAGVDQTVKSGERLVLVGTDTLSAATETATEDDFSKWCRAHDYHPERLAAPYHVSPAMTGYEELDSYGQWGPAPQYGTVWYPQSVAADWAPYREGYWVWIEPWGWSWVDDEPWGFAPFHYGRWAQIAGRWAWVPGAFVPEPVYAPALVAFVALPAAAGPVVGWFPLAPGEVYWPAYTRDPAYIRNVNVTSVNIVTLRNITRVAAAEPVAGPPPEVVHQRFANLAAAVIAPARAFATAAPVAPAAVRSRRRSWRGAVTVRPPPVVAAPLKGAVATTRPAAVLPPSLARSQPPAPPNFAHLEAAPGKAPPAGNASRQVAQPASTPQQPPAAAAHAPAQPSGRPAPPGAARPAASTAATTDKGAEAAAPRAAQEAAARQAEAAAQQRAAQEAAARQRAAQAAAQQRAAREAAARERAAQAAAQQRAAQEAAGRQAHPPPSHPACGQPGQPPCPH